jgi:hypothetical protein
MAAPTLFWLQEDGVASQLGSVTNPVVNVDANQTTTLYLWADPDGVSYGFDGISFDVLLITDDGGQASATLNLDEPQGRWHGVNDGDTRTDSGGVGVEDSNMIDLTNTDTLGPDPIRLGSLDITGVSPGKLYLFLCVGKYGSTDGGSNAIMYFGFGATLTSPETLNISGGVDGFCSNVPEATINVGTAGVTYVGDFDDDQDVDSNDFGHLQVCLNGAFPQTDPNCSDASLNGDDLVNADDVTVFLGCFSGPNLQPPPECQD